MQFTAFKDTTKHAKNYINKIKSWLGCTKIHYKPHNNIVIKSIPNRICYGIMAWLTIDVLLIKSTDHFCTKIKCKTQKTIKIILDSIFFCHVKNVMIDMAKGLHKCYQNPIHKVVIGWILGRESLKLSFHVEVMAFL